MKNTGIKFKVHMSKKYSHQKVVHNGMPLNKFIFIFILAVLSVLPQYIIAQKGRQKGKAGKSAWVTNNPFKTDVFIENFGQFDNWATTESKIKYAINKGDKIFFTAHGYTIRVDKIVKKEESDTDDDKDIIKGSTAKNIEDDEEENRILEKYAVHVNWLGSNPNPEIIVSGSSSNYYTFGEKGYENVKAKGFKKLTYKNLYPQIDVEYTIPEKGGIKYKLILHPGADIGKVKMEYTGDVDNSIIDFEGNIIINTPVGAIVDHAPQSYYEGNNTNIPSTFILKDNVVSFKLNELQTPNSQPQTIIIDPWTTIPTGLVTDNAAYDIAYDDNGNVYVSGGTDPFKLSKYSAAGGLLWTYTVPAGWAQQYYSKFCILPQSGTSFIGEGFDVSGPMVEKINSSGTLTYTTPNLTGNKEIWVMFYNRCTGRLCGFGGGTANANNMQVIADTNLTSSAVGDFNGYNTSDNDISTAVEDLNGDFYALMSSQVAYNGHLLKSLTSTNYTPPCAFDVNTGYNFYECTYTAIPGFSNNCMAGSTVRANALANNNNYLFSYDGMTIKAWNKTTGAALGSIIVNAGYGAGQNETHDGIAVDDCSNVYVGGTNQVHVFSFSGTAFTAAGSIPMSNEVYDIQIDKMSGLLYVSGLGFVTVTPASITCNVNQLTLNIAQTPGFCNGSATVTATGGTAPYTYIWSNGSTTNSINNVPAGWYYVTVTDNSCIRLKGIDSILITSSFPTTICNDTTVCNGIPVPLWATGGATYTWAPGGSLSNTSIANPIASPISTTTYYVTISNGTCNVLDSVKVTISPAPSVTVTNGSICNGQQDTLFAGGATTYAWSNGSVNSYLVVGPAVTTPYTVTGTTTGCTANATGTMTVNPIPNAQISPFANATCGLNNGSATATGGSTYLWNGGQTMATITGLAAGNYAVTVTSAAGCSSNATVTINNIPIPSITAISTNENCGHANGTASSTPNGGILPYHYLWSNSQTAQNIINLPAGIYTVTLTDANSCTASASVTIINIAGPSLQIVSFINETCSYGNGSATVNAINGAPPYQYLWSNGNGSATSSNLHAGTYTITVTDANTCTAINTVTIANTPGPTANISGINLASCGMSDGSVVLNVNGGTLPYVFSWNSTPPQATQNLINVPTGNYTVTITDANSCSATVPIHIGQKPGPSATTISTNEICDQANGTATINATGGLGTYTYLWSNGQTTPIATGLVQGSYTVTVSDGGCSTVQTVNVMETLGPDAAFTAHPKILTIMDGPVTFTDNSTGNVVNWQWIYGDNSPNGSSPDNTHPYPIIGTYLVTLIVTDNNGCKDTISDTIKVKDIFTFYIPNTFTPNGDGYNDFFTPRGVNVDPNKYNESIYDRWGNLIFQTSKWNENLHQAETWNGTKNNSGTINDVLMDVYVYRIVLNEIDGPKHEYIGRITLVP
jgi:gliding motility-associated-like protein